MYDVFYLLRNLNVKLMKESTLEADMIVELRFFLIFIARERPLFHDFATNKFERT